jgi:polyphosphate kinase
MRGRFLELIDREASHARAGREAGIRVAMNGLSDKPVIEALYRASQAGVPIDMMVRGVCALQPGVSGISDNIRVVSVVGPLLQHARIFHFRNGGADEYFIGSADWRPRNFRRRVEVMAPVRDADARARLDRILEMEWADPTAWEMGPAGEYVRRSGVEGPSVQERFAMEAAEAAPIS